MSRTSGWRSALAGLVCCASSSSAAAQDVARPRVRFTYARGVGVERCPSVEEVRDTVAARLGYVPFDDRATHRIDLRIERSARGLRARVSWLDGEERTLGERDHEMPAARCVELVEAAALDISIVVDTLPREAPALPAPVALQSEPIAPPTPMRPPSGAAQIVPIARAPAAEALPSPTRFEGWVGLGAVLTFGTQPDPGLGGTLELGLRWRMLALAVEGRLDAPTTTATTGEGRANTSRTGLSVMPCGVAPRGASQIRLGGCAVAAFAWLAGRGENVMIPREDDAWLFAVGGRLFAGFALGRHVELRAHVDVMVPVRRAVVRLDGGVLWEEAAVGGMGGLKVVGHFP